MTGAAVLLGADVPAIVLAASVVVLLACTALLSWTLPSFGWRRWWRSRARARAPRARTVRRRAITGPPPALPAGPVPSAPAPRPLLPARQRGDAADVQRPGDGPSEAEAMIEYLLETDPDRIAWLMMHWIRDDARPRSSR